MVGSGLLTIIPLFLVRFRPIRIPMPPPTLARMPCARVRFPVLSMCIGNALLSPCGFSVVIGMAKIEAVALRMTCIRVATVTCK